MRGRKPVPSSLNELRGNPGKRPPSRDEPQPEKGAPEPPPHLDGEAQAEWQRLVALLGPDAINLLTLADRGTLACYCVAWSRWVAAEAQVKTYGAVLIAESGAFYQSPYLAVANRAMEQLAQYGAMLGLDPSSRTRLHAAPKGGKKTSGKARFFDNLN